MATKTKPMPVLYRSGTKWAAKVHAVHAIPGGEGVDKIAVRTLCGRIAEAVESKKFVPNLSNACGRCVKALQTISDEVKGGAEPTNVNLLIS